MLRTERENALAREVMASSFQDAQTAHEIQMVFMHPCWLAYEILALRRASAQHTDRMMPVKKIGDDNTVINRRAHFMLRFFNLFYS